MALKKWKKGAKPPVGYEIIAPVMEALENELRDKVKESNAQKRKTESVWPVFQINHQRTRYIYDMFHTYNRISRKVYDYCIKNKLADGALIAKWKKPGYERLCSTYVINPQNYKFGTVSICRVPLKDRSEEQMIAQDPTTGCRGCASGKGASPKNIFGNKYGQNLAAVQIAREARMERMKARREQEELMRSSQEEINNEESDIQAKEYNNPNQESIHNGEGDSETDDDDDDDDDDYGPSPAAGVWAGSKKLIEVAEQDDNSENSNIRVGENKIDERPNKKLRVD